MKDYIENWQPGTMLLFNAPRGWGVHRFACEVVKLITPVEKVQITAHGRRLTSLLAQHLHDVNAPADQVLLTNAIEGTIGNDACNVLIITPECFRVFFADATRQTLIDNKRVVLLYDGELSDDFLGKFYVWSQIEHKAQWLHDRSSEVGQPFLKLLRIWMAMKIALK